MASASQSEQWKWKTLIEAALLECDLAKLPQRIIDAQKVVTERLQCIDGTLSDKKRISLLDARNVLCDLCKMAGLADTSGQEMKRDTSHPLD